MWDSSLSPELRRRDRILHAAGLGVTIFVAAAVYGLAYLPLDQNRIQLDRTVRACQAFLSQAESIRQEHRELTRQHAATEDKMAHLLMRIPESAREADFLAELSTLADGVDFVIHDYRPGQVKQLERHRELEIQVQAEGTYEGTCRFLQGLERLERFCHLSKLGIVAKADAPTQHMVQMGLHIFFASQTDITQGRRAETASK